MLLSWEKDRPDMWGRNHMLHTATALRPRTTDTWRKGRPASEVERTGTRNAQEQEDHWEREPYDHSVLTVHRSVGKESACHAGDPSLIPGLGISAGEGIGSPLQYSWASLVAQLVKNPPAMQETWVRSLGLEDPLEKGKATHSNILA